MGVAGGEEREGGSRERERETERQRDRESEGQTGRHRWREGRRKEGVRERPALPIQYTAGGLGEKGWGVCKPGGSQGLALLAGSLLGCFHRKVASSSVSSSKSLTSALVDCLAQAPLSASRSLCDLNLPTKILR